VLQVDQQVLWAGTDADCPSVQVEGGTLENLFACRDPWSELAGAAASPLHGGEYGAGEEQILACSLPIISPATQSEHIE